MSSKGGKGCEAEKQALKIRHRKGKRHNKGTRREKEKTRHKEKKEKKHTIKAQREKRQNEAK